MLRQGWVFGEQGYRIWMLANWERMLMRKLSSQPARFSLPRIGPLLGSSRARFSTSLGSDARFSAQCRCNAAAA